MRHRAAVWIVPLLLLTGLVTGLGAAAPPAQAAQRPGGGLASGLPVTASIGTAGDSVAYTFTGTAYQHADFEVTASSWSTVDGAALTWYRPDGTALDQCFVATVTASAPKPCDVTPDTTGTWTLAIEPAENGIGQLTFTYLTDQDLGTLTPATAVTTTFSTPGQNAVYRFAGTAGQRVLFDLTAFDLGPRGTARLGFTAPGGTDLATYCVLSVAPDLCTLTPNVTGTWTVSLDPTDSDTGAVTFVYGSDQAGGALSPGKAVVATIAAANQVATFTFTATKGVPVTFAVGAASWVSQPAGYLYFFAPGATALTSHCSASVGVDCRLTPAVSGTWHLTVSASGGTGRTTVTYLPDLTRGYLTKGRKVTTTIATPGQNATYTFPATAGHATKLAVTGSRWSKGAVVRLWVFPPSGSPLFDSCSVARSTARSMVWTTTCTTVPNAGGTWRVELDPQGDAVGRLTLMRR